MYNRIGSAIFAALILAIASPVIASNTVVQTKNYKILTSKVLATVNGQKLTQRMVDTHIEFGEFLANHEFTAAEKLWVTEIQVKDFKNNPSEELQGYKSIEEIATGIRKFSKEPIKLTRIREKLILYIHLSRLKENQVNKPSIMTIVYKYSQVIFADPKHRIVVTKRAIDALYVSENFLAKLVGEPLKIADYKSLSQYFQQVNEEAFSPLIKENLISADSRWGASQRAWPRTTPQQKQKLIAAIKNDLQKGTKLSYIARTLENIWMDEYDTSEAQRELNSLWRTNIEIIKLRTLIGK